MPTSRNAASGGKRRRAVTPTCGRRTWVRGRARLAVGLPVRQTRDERLFHRRPRADSRRRRPFPHPGAAPVRHGAAARLPADRGRGHAHRRLFGHGPRFRGRPLPPRGAGDRRRAAGPQGRRAGGAGRGHGDRRGGPPAAARGSAAAALRPDLVRRRLDRGRPRPARGARARLPHPPDRTFRRPSGRSAGAGPAAHRRAVRGHRRRRRRRRRGAGVLSRGTAARQRGRGRRHPGRGRRQNPARLPGDPGEPAGTAGAGAGAAPPPRPPGRGRGAGGGAPGRRRGAAQRRHRLGHRRGGPGPVPGLRPAHRRARLRARAVRPCRSRATTSSSRSATAPP